MEIGPYMPQTYWWTFNRNGLPWRAEFYVCFHGYPQDSCQLGDDHHRDTGRLMLEHINGQSSQYIQRAADRDRITYGRNNINLDEV